jgi:hypothetical protein
MSVVVRSTVQILALICVPRQSPFLSRSPIYLNICQFQDACGGPCALTPNGNYHPPGTFLKHCPPQVIDRFHMMLDLDPWESPMRTPATSTKVHGLFQFTRGLGRTVQLMIGANLGSMAGTFRQRPSELAETTVKFASLCKNHALIWSTGSLHSQRSVPSRGTLSI